MDLGQLQSCVKQYRFLSPRLQTAGFSTVIQRTHCDSKHQRQLNVCQSSFLKSLCFPLGFLSARRRASCEHDSSVSSATSQIEQAHKDLSQNSSSIISEIDIQNYLAMETGKDRLIKMVSKDHLGNYGPEMQFIYQVTLQSTALTFICSTFLAGRRAKQDFLDRNQATVFKTRFQAFRRLQDVIFLASLKDGAKWSLRILLFSVSFLTISQGIAVYRNKSSLWEYTIATGVTTGLAKFNLGPGAMLVSFGLGAVMGTIGGLFIYGFMKATDETQEQRHYWQIQKELEKEKILSGQVPTELITKAAANAL